MPLLRLLLTLLCIGPTARGEDHWAYLPRLKVEPPADTHPVDFLLKNAWKSARIHPAKLAPPARWVHRAAHTLTGLPPSADHLRRIQATPDELTWLAIVDEMLATPAYGERWARHWMDVARYADTRGYFSDRENRYPFAYTYREWLIRAFNEDLPFDRFVKLQIAADLLTDRPDHPDLAALGFLTVGPRSGDVETIDDRVDVITRGFLSSTVACARCHDHKTDPITTEDYYSIYSILENTTEPAELPVIGKPPSDDDHRAYLAEAEKLQAAHLAARQERVDHLRAPDSLANYLHLAWRAKKEDWDHGKATAEGFKLGRYRPQSILVWRDFLNDTAWKENPHERLARWAAEMDAAADDPARLALCVALAAEWNAATDGPLREIFAHENCPLSYGTDRITKFNDTQDDKDFAERDSALSRLQVEHPGSPPRAMSLSDRPDPQPARVFHRGNPSSPGEPFEREWLGFLGGGKFPEGKSPRLALAEKIADPANPITARVIANRVWAWHFGAPLTEPGDFGPQQPEPALRPLLDHLATHFIQNGQSLKNLHRLLLTSRAFRLDSHGPEGNLAKDEANSLFWKWNRRRADFESMRDRLLATAGSLDTSTTGGRSVPINDPSADPRRSLYAFVDRYDFPGTFVSFDLPHPDHHAPKRVETTVPQQALYFLNSPLLLRQAEKLAADPAFTALPGDPARITHLYQRLFQRDPAPAEIETSLRWLASTDPAHYLPRLGGHWEILHAPDAPAPIPGLQPFPLIHENTWKTAEDLATAPIPWLSAAAGHGHPASGHALVLRWRATGPGQIKMTGSIQRSAPAGDTTQWQIADKLGANLASADLPPTATTPVDTPWLQVLPGDTLDFILRAPHGHNSASAKWTLKILGKEDPASTPVEISDLARHFPTTATPPPAPAPAPADPWADLIQMLWASNEFHFID